MGRARPSGLAQALAALLVAATLLFLSSCASGEGEGDAGLAAPVSYQNVYCVNDPASGERLYTADLDEAVSRMEGGWRYGGVSWVAPSTSGTPVYRLASPDGSGWRYTADADERERLAGEGWHDEGVCWYSDDAEGAPEVLCQREATEAAGEGEGGADGASEAVRNYTQSSDEAEALCRAGWSDEGVAWHASAVETQPIEGRWVVVSAWGQPERYWLGPDASLARNRLVTPEEGAGYYAYAKADGAVVRGAYDAGAGHVYLADADGRLASTSDGHSGWLVTGDYAGGELRRYWMDMEAHAAVSGLFEVEGAHYYGLPGQGNVLCGKMAYGQGVLLADADGRLAWEEGWLEASAYDGGVPQRYRIDSSPGDGLRGARVGAFELDGNLYYGLPGEGYVARDVSVDIDGTTYAADDAGVLSEVALYLTATGGEHPSLGEVEDLSIEVSLADQRVYVMSGDAAVYAMVCSTGLDDSTPSGTYYVQNRGPEFYNASEGMGGNYWVSWSGSGSYLFHTVPTDESGEYIVSEAEKLGQPASHGCIRLSIPDAQWLYDELPRGTVVRIG